MIQLSLGIFSTAKTAALRRFPIDNGSNWKKIRPEKPPWDPLYDFSHPVWWWHINPIQGLNN
jgi:hypothetical protein